MRRLGQVEPFYPTTTIIRCSNEKNSHPGYAWVIAMGKSCPRESNIMVKIIKLDKRIAGKKVTIACPTCNLEREIIYQQLREIERGKYTGNCYKCSYNLRPHKPSRLGIPSWNKGIKGYKKGHPPYFVATGSKNPAWKGGITPFQTKIRNSSAYSNWRLYVMQRDNFTCQFCGKRGGKLEVDHIVPFSRNLNLRLDPNNGRTLCKPCHKKTNTYCGRATKWQEN